MKIDRRRRALLALSFVSLLATTHAASSRDSLTAKKLDTERSTVTEAQDELVGTTVPKVGTEHAPFDGKDGMPHDGPWVETNAQRERQKSNDDPDDPVTLKSFKKGLKEADIPRSNDGVMDDPARKAPVDGTRGTEGGVSEKSRTKDNSYSSREKAAAKKPESPKELPSFSQSERQKTKATEDADEDAVAVSEEKNKLKLEKPTDLPEKPHSIPHPENPSSPVDHKLHQDDSISHSSTYKSSKPLEPEEAGVIQPLHSLLLSFTMILFSEIGDKTFLVACLMAMRHDRILVFTAAFSALVTMTVLSAVLGHAVPTLIPKDLTNFLAAGLFLVFGIKMLMEARKISPDEGVSEEMKEVEMELEEKEQHAAARSRRISHRQSEISPYILEAGRARSKSSPSSSPSSSRSSSPSRTSTLKSMTAGFNNLFSLLLSPAWVQTFVMTFLGEWGDRSQIATIAMAAGQDYWWVTAGALGGHAICTGVAVIGGKAIAGRVSLRTVTMGGAIAFLVFGVIYLLEAFY